MNQVTLELEDYHRLQKFERAVNEGLIVAYQKEYNYLLKSYYKEIVLINPSEEIINLKESIENANKLISELSEKIEEKDLQISQISIIKEENEELKSQKNKSFWDYIFKI